MNTPEIIQIEGGHEFMVGEDGYKCCGCGRVLKKVEGLSRHVRTKSHYDATQWRKDVGNTCVHVSLLTKGLRVYR